jgi:hypothetical protein
MLRLMGLRLEGYKPCTDLRQNLFVGSIVGSKSLVRVRVANIADIVKESLGRFYGLRLIRFI